MRHNHRYSHSEAPHRTLVLVILLTVGFAFIEVVGGYFAHSLSLLGDAGHMTSDAIALGITAFASWIASHPPSPRHSYGLGRAEVIAAWVSSLLMFVVSLIVIVQAVKRIHHPLPVQTFPIIIIAIAGILLNLLFAKLLSSNKKSLNIHAALLHVLSDLIGTGATLISGIVISFTHWTLIDPLLSIFISVLIMVSSAQLLHKSMMVLMESVPHHLNIFQVSQTIDRFDGVKSVHDIHIWTLSSGTTALSAHVNIKNLTVWDDLLLGLKAILKQKYHIDHITLQPEVNIKDCNPCYKI
ncbi:cation diffusion facilitator family transporter [Coxiella endosymbiont of Dermacentor marginatus]|uniref:cation diffusion facilitator family transporter n=1 Tax=Coxiella endosymbiont of Dermacentor marginatus TaxID=1656159 RepID=UPI002221D0E4|nr:cation diffusion facilitator family transporter [Coxiella endosymbiont of Dermacentor marginatus]